MAKIAATNGEYVSKEGIWLWNMMSRQWEGEMGENKCGESVRVVKSMGKW